MSYVTLSEFRINLPEDYDGGELVRFERGTIIWSNKNGNIHYRMYNTDIVTLNPQLHTIKLDNGGYYTPSTKDKMNKILICCIGERCIYQKSWVWYYKDTEYFNGMLLDYNGNVLNEKGEKNNEL